MSPNPRPLGPHEASTPKNTSNFGSLDADPCRSTNPAVMWVRDLLSSPTQEEKLTKQEAAKPSLKTVSLRPPNPKPQTPKPKP